MIAKLTIGVHERAGKQTFSEQQMVNGLQSWQRMLSYQTMKPKYKLS